MNLDPVAILRGIFRDHLNAADQLLAVGNTQLAQAELQAAIAVLDQLKTLSQPQPQPKAIIDL